MGSWDPRTTYDVSEKELGLMKKRSEMRAQLKAYWIKEFNNPHTRVRHLWKICFWSFIVKAFEESRFKFFDRHIETKALYLE